MASPHKLSGMQKQVLGLYRSFLRAARKKAPEERCKIESVVSAEFRHNARDVDRKNFLYIEYLMRRGKRQLEQLESSSTVSLSMFNLTTLEDTTSTANDGTSEPASSKFHGDKTGKCPPGNVNHDNTRTSCRCSRSFHYLPLADQQIDYSRPISVA